MPPSSLTQCVLAVLSKHMQGLSTSQLSPQHVLKDLPELGFSALNYDK